MRLEEDKMDPQIELLKCMFEAHASVSINDGKDTFSITLQREDATTICKALTLLNNVMESQRRAANMLMAQGTKIKMT